MSPHVFLARVNHNLINVNHCHKLGFLLQKLVEESSITTPQYQNFLVFVIIVTMTHEIVSVGQVRLCQVHEAIQHQTVAKVICSVDLHQLKCRFLREDKFSPVVLQDPVITGPQVWRPGQTSLHCRNTVATRSVQTPGDQLLHPLNIIKSIHQTISIIGLQISEVQDKYYKTSYLIP